MKKRSDIIDEMNREKELEPVKLTPLGERAKAGNIERFNKMSKLRRCKSCLHENNKDDLYCANCGFQLRTYEQFLQSLGDKKVDDLTISELKSLEKYQDVEDRKFINHQTTKQIVGHGIIWGIILAIFGLG